MKGEEFRGKNVMIVGLGRSGIAALDAAAGFGAKVFVQDSKKEDELPQEIRDKLSKLGAVCFLGRKPQREDLEKIHTMVISPGVSPELDFVAEAASLGVNIIGELELAYETGRGNFIAITGTNGKTTTTTLVGEIFKASGRPTSVVGNIGIAVIPEALAATDDRWLVTEVSSFQLETIKEFKPVVSAILNLTPDHLNRHHTMENYGLAKARVFENQDENQYYVANMDDEESFKLSKLCKKAKVVPFSRKKVLDFGACVIDGIITIIDEQGKNTAICKAEELQIPGAHNLENALAAAAICYFAGIEPKVISETLKNFMGVAHRLEYCDTVNGVRYVNDSKGTNPDASIKAIEAMKGNIILIAGGYDKGSDFTDFIKEFKGRVKHMVLMGVTAPKIKEQAEACGFTNLHMVANMEQAVKKCSSLGVSGDVVLLSPACASWDMYKCFEDRGQDFKEQVAKLQAK